MTSKKLSRLARPLFIAGFILALVSFSAGAQAEEDYIGHSNLRSGRPQQTPEGLLDTTSQIRPTPVQEGKLSDRQPYLALGETGSASDPLTNFGAPSGTVVGNRSLELREEVLRLRSSVNLNTNQFNVLRSTGATGAVQYHSTVAAIMARLQNGTTRGNPILMRQWEEASSSLDEVTTSLGRLNALLIAIDQDNSMAAYLAQSIKAAYELSGAVDEDHEQLKLLSDEVNRQQVQLNYLRDQTTHDIERQTNYLTTERANLQQIAFAIGRGEMMNEYQGLHAPQMVPVEQAPLSSPFAQPQSYMPSGNFSPSAASPSDTQPQMNPSPSQPVTSSHTTSSSYPAELATQLSLPTKSSMRSAPLAVSPTLERSSPDRTSSNGRLLVLIRYNQPVIEYRQQLSRAIGAAVERHPDAEFSVVAVSPAVGDQTELSKTQDDAKRDAEDVRHSMIQLGLSPSHITLANTQMPSAQYPEVHIYMH